MQDHLSDALSYLYHRLDERRSAGNFRQLRSDELPHDFLSNDYLGLAKNQKLFNNIQSRISQVGIKRNGSGGSRLLSGNHQLMENLEQKLSEIFRAESCLLFNSGYNANLALISSVARKGDTILYDQLSHVCLKEGARLSRAQSFKFVHNNLTDLEKKLKQAQGNVFIVTESVFSMDGDECPIEALIEIAAKYGANLIVDEAHSTGCYGQGGNGWLCQQGLEQKIFARVYTFGKAVGTHGACIAGSKILIDYLINFGNPFIYTTALPLHSIIAIEEAFSFIQDNPHLKTDLQDKIDHFLQCIKHLKLRLNEGSLSNTAIQPIVIPGNEKVRSVAHQLNAVGYDLRPIMAPTVSAGAERIRLSLHVHNTTQEIDDLVDSLALLLKE